MGGVDLVSVNVDRSFDHPIITKELLGALSTSLSERVPTVWVLKQCNDGPRQAVSVSNRC